MPYEYTPPKYARVVAEIQRRIESGEYPPGSMLPSEHQLSDEFQIARPTTVRALRVLRQDGWIETQQGKGSFVRGRPALAGLETQRPGEEALNRDESDEPGELIQAGVTAPPARVAALLGLDDGKGGACPAAACPARRRSLRDRHLVGSGSALADGTDLAGDKPVAGGVRAHLARRKNVAR